MSSSERILSHLPGSFEFYRPVNDGNLDNQLRFNDYVLWKTGVKSTIISKATVLCYALNELCAKSRRGRFFESILNQHHKWPAYRPNPDLIFVQDYKWSTSDVNQFMEHPPFERRYKQRAETVWLPGETEVLPIWFHYIPDTQSKVQSFLDPEFDLQPGYWIVCKNGTKLLGMSRENMKHRARTVSTKLTRGKMEWDTTKEIRNFDVASGTPRRIDDHATTISSTKGDPCVQLLKYIQNEWISNPESTILWIQACCIPQYDVGDRYRLLKTGRASHGYDGPMDLDSDDSGSEYVFEEDQESDSDWGQEQLTADDLKVTPAQQKGGFSSKKKESSSSKKKIPPQTPPGSYKVSPQLARKNSQALPMGSYLARADFIRGSMNKWARLAYVTESNVFHLAFGSPILRSFEQSAFDGLLYGGSDIPEGFQSEPFLERTNIAVRREKHTKSGSWIPFDVKSTRFPSATTDSRTKPSDDIMKERNTRPFLRYRATKLPEAQEKHCQFFIKSYALAPDTLILVPWTLIHLMSKVTARPDHLLLATRIPPAFAHLAFPNYQLPEALENVRQAVSTGVYVNPYNGVRIPFKPKLFTLSEARFTPISSTSTDPRVRGFGILSEAVESSQKGKEGYFLDFHPYQPCGADATLHGPDGREWDIEIKLRSSLESGSSLVLPFSPGMRGFEDATSPLGSWNFLMLCDEKAGFCYWFPRDKMKLEWSSLFPGNEETRFLRIPKKDVQEFRVDIRRPDWFSYVVDRIILPNRDVPLDSLPHLKRFIEAGSDLHLDSLDLGEIDPDDDEDAEEGLEASEDMEAEKEPDDQEVVEGVVQRSDNLRVEPFWLYWTFQAQCALTGRGLFFPLNADHPAGNYAYIDWSWTDKEVEKFFDAGLSPAFYGDGFMAPGTPAVPIHFYQVATADMSRVQGIHHDNVGVSEWRKGKHIFIGEPHLDTHMWDIDRGVYLIPSGECCDEPRDTFFAHGYNKKALALLIDYLPKEKFAPTYIVSGNDVVPKLQTLMAEYKRSGTQPTHFGRARIIPDDYIVTVSDLLMQM